MTQIRRTDLQISFDFLFMRMQRVIKDKIELLEMETIKEREHLYQKLREEFEAKQAPQEIKQREDGKG